MRHESTEAKRRLWNLLRNRSLGGLKFVRQYPTGSFIADFICRDLMLVIEVDGSQHADSPDDVRRTAFLNSKGYAVVRFWNNEILENLDGVYQALSAIAAGVPSPGWRYSPATLSPEGRGDQTADAAVRRSK